MAFPESLPWTFEGKEADEFVEKISTPEEPRPLVTGSRHEMDHVRKVVVENARKRKAEQRARKREE
jgi:hypothetical protein